MPTPETWLKQFYAGKVPVVSQEEAVRGRERGQELGRQLGQMLLNALERAKQSERPV